MARFYPILDLELARACGHDPLQLARGIAELDLPWLQVRAKTLGAGEFLDWAIRLRAILAESGGRTRLIVNDRADIACLSQAAGLHLGQDDLPLAAAARLLPPAALLGFSTHNEEQLRLALAEDGRLAGAPAVAAKSIRPRLRALAYIAFGPVFSTATKVHPDPVTGLAALQRMRAQFDGPLVAIGGIGHSHCRAVADAGADYAAVISGWLAAANPLAEVRHFLLALADSPAVH